jgi:hypothetical protein
MRLRPTLLQELAGDGVGAVEEFGQVEGVFVGQAALDQQGQRDRLARPDVVDGPAGAVRTKVEALLEPEHAGIVRRAG